jgi:hypothetical protein
MNKYISAKTYSMHRRHLAFAKTAAMTHATTTEQHVSLDGLDALEGFDRDVWLFDTRDDLPAMLPPHTLHQLSPHEPLQSIEDPGQQGDVLVFTLPDATSHNPFFAKTIRIPSK